MGEILPALRLGPPAGPFLECLEASIRVILVVYGYFVKPPGNRHCLLLLSELVQHRRLRQHPGPVVCGEPGEDRRRPLERPAPVRPAQVPQLGHTLKRGPRHRLLEHAKPVGEPADAARLVTPEAVPHLERVAERLLVLAPVQRARRPPALPPAATLGMPGPAQHLGDRHPSWSRAAYRARSAPTRSRPCGSAGPAHPAAETPGPA